MESDHNWKRTGEFHPTTNPIWFLKCECGAFAKEFTNSDGSTRSIEIVWAVQHKQAEINS